MLLYLTPLAAIAVLFSYFVFSRIVQLLRSPLRAIPGPWIARFSDGWYFWHLRARRFEQVNQDLHAKHGPIVRYGPHRYTFRDPDAAKVIYGLGSGFAKSPWYTTWSVPGKWNLFSDQSVSHHAETRRLYQAAYSMSTLIRYEPYVDECISIFMQHLSKMAQSSQPVDMGYWFQCYAFDVIGMMSYGKRLGFLDHGYDIGGVIRALEDHLHYATLTGVYPWLHRYLYRLKNYWAGAKGAGRAYVLEFTNEKIREHQMTSKTTDTESMQTAQMEDFLTKFWKKHESDPNRFTMYHVVVGLSANMVAGSDTTAISLSATLYHLLKNPQCLTRLQDELDSFTSRGLLSAKPLFSETQQMQYLQAVIKEALRIHPATGLPLERVVPDGGATICGQYFPAGNIVGINTWVEHRNQDIFGKDADMFRPERWIEGDKDAISLMNRHWMPFGLGSRTCIGRHISMLEMSKLISIIVRDFEFKLEDGSGSTWCTENLWFVKPRGFRVFIQERKSALF